LIAPLVNLGYYQAFWVFDAFQFALLPIIAFLLYNLLEKKNPIAVLLIIVAVLLCPYPMPGWGLSGSYFMSWVEGQAKILLSFLLLVSFYLGYKGRPVLSGIVFALGAFDPRFGILGLPLFLFYNKNVLRDALGPAMTAFVASNILFFYPGTAQGFFNMVLSSGVTTPIYKFAWIPLIMLLSLIAVNAKQMFEVLRHARTISKIATIVFIIAVIVVAVNTRFVLNW
jgi:hypothetical protein